MATREIEVFQVFYDGPVPARRHANTIVLVPALVAVTDLFTAVMSAVHGNTKRLRVEVHRGVKPGYFGVRFLQVEDETRKTSFGTRASSEVATVSVLLLLAAPMCGLIWFLRHLRGLPPNEVAAARRRLANRAIDKPFEGVDPRTLAMWRCPKVRKSLAAALAPLRRGGYTSFNLIRDRNVWLQIKADEVDTFAATNRSRKPRSTSKTKQDPPA